MRATLFTHAMRVCCCRVLHVCRFIEAVLWAIVVLLSAAVIIIGAVLFMPMTVAGGIAMGIFGLILCCLSMIGFISTLRQGACALEEQEGERLIALV